MRRNCLLLTLLLLSIKVLAFIDIEALSVTATESGASLSKLYDPHYPPLARQARITGDVVLSLHVRQDGSIESAEVVSGHPMLNDAALNSAKNSEFQCHGCEDAITDYSMTYTFGLTNHDKCCEEAPNSTQQENRLKPGVFQVGNHITVLAEPTCICDPSAEIRRVRSAKCLYLWRCGDR